MDENKQEIENFISSSGDPVLVDAWKIFNKNISRDLKKAEIKGLRNFTSRLRVFKRKFDKYKTIYPTYYSAMSSAEQEIKEIVSQTIVKT